MNLSLTTISGHCSKWLWVSWNRPQDLHQGVAYFPGKFFFTSRKHKIDNEFWSVEDKPSQQDLRPIPRQPIRKRIVIQEQANVVRTIPNENNGKKHQGGKPIRRYSTEPTWLDRYKTQHSDEELSEVSDDEDEGHITQHMHLWLQALRS